mmetsp:Transcript_51875/g.60641  ORF Transcript_51875/g.60641 Transcript_51875/m.60641 type:complete len:114 (+) Transcript_51875:1273-1614(+)
MLHDAFDICRTIRRILPNEEPLSKRLHTAQSISSATLRSDASISHQGLKATWRTGEFPSNGRLMFVSKNVPQTEPSETVSALSPNVLLFFPKDEVESNDSKCLKHSTASRAMS